jgi:hypothetical protein
MSMADEHKFKDGLPDEENFSHSPLKALLHKLQNSPLQYDEIKVECLNLKKVFLSSNKPPEPEAIKSIIFFLDKSPNEIKECLYSFVESAVPQLTDVWDIIKLLLALEDERLVCKVLNLIIKLAEENILKIDEKLINLLANRFIREDNLFNDQSVIRKYLPSSV